MKAGLQLDYDWRMGRQKRFSSTLIALALLMTSPSGGRAAAPDEGYICTGYEWVIITIIMLEKFCSAKVGSFDDDFVASLKKCSNSNEESEKEAIDVLNRVRNGDYEGLAFTEEFIKEHFEGLQKESGEDVCAKVPRE